MYDIFVMISESSFDFDRYKQVGSRPKRVDSRTKSLNAADVAHSYLTLSIKMSGDSKRDGLIRRRFVQAAIGPCLPTEPIKKNPFTISCSKVPRPKSPWSIRSLTWRAPPKTPFTSVVEVESYQRV